MLSQGSTNNNSAQEIPVSKLKLHFRDKNVEQYD